MNKISSPIIRYLIFNPRHYTLAVLHYLNTGDFGGTAFYKHTSTQFKTIQQIECENRLRQQNNFILRTLVI
ncbi:DUF6445 family protein [Paraglaciecola sp. L3A3]|uniref:DUF6445 family protein n=1 Tax=Paraglaciecola sp. L3A3 TaxID=2686358 RepID=UPI00351A6DA8